ncbi:hypothetical protein O181_005928 [Austropuccinia psidii MF-1]|uniref:Uncharacterized protein n=1 Tax=Austropuccinia psidii MF-1 TaxID=1389203 RepID=A0A9Q3BJG9_9BASI|nr:hypothetical protein [Austropuccinia psidii MF-1]
MPVQHSPPANNTRSQRIQAVLTATERALLDFTPSIHQLGANLESRSPMEGAVPSRTGVMKSKRSRSFSGLLILYLGIFYGPRSRLKEAEDEEEEETEEAEVEAALEGATKAPEDSNLAISHHPLVSQAKPNFLKMIEHMTQSMQQLTQEASPRDDSRAPEFKTPYMKAPDYFDDTQAHKLRRFIQSCQLILHNEPASFFYERKKFLFSLVELEKGLNNISQIFSMKTHIISSIMGSCLKPSYSLFLVIPMRPGNMNKS